MGGVVADVPVYINRERISFDPIKSIVDLGYWQISPIILLQFLQLPVEACHENDLEVFVLQLRDWASQFGLV